MQLKPLLQWPVFIVALLAMFYLVILNMVSFEIEFIISSLHFLKSNFELCFALLTHLFFFEKLLIFKNFKICKFSSLVALQIFYNFFLTRYTSAGFRKPFFVILDLPSCSLIL